MGIDAGESPASPVCSGAHDPPMESSPGIKIAIDQLAPETVRGIIEEFVTRDGTELTAAVTKIRQVEDLLRRGVVEIWFDAETRTCNILPT